MNAWFPVLASVLAAVGVASGAWWTVRGKDLSATVQRRLGRSLAVAAGALAAVVLLDIWPDTTTDDFSPWLTAAGFFGLWTLTAAADAWFGKPSGDVQTASGLRPLSLGSAGVLAISLSVHSLLEGGALALPADLKGAAIGTGWVLLTAIVLHKLPEGLLWGLALQRVFATSTSQDRRRLAVLLFIPAVCTVVGTLAGERWFAQHPAVLDRALAVLAGALLYISLCELFPAVRELAARINAYELAFRMQAQAPHAVDLSSEPESIKRMYGLDRKECSEFAHRCL
ncbi:MAG: DUF1501 domain-containing protein, partial [Alicyclobacillus sp.]|nr:DUF1501 domain-containing protein [Alicyclobacillus sp.]